MFSLFVPAFRGGAGSGSGGGGGEVKYHRTSFSFLSFLTRRTQQASWQS